MDQIPLVTSSTLIPLENFWTSVLVYHDRPNVVNRKLAAVSPLLLCEISLHCPKIKRISDIFTWEALIYEIRKLQDWTKITPEFIRSVIEIHDKAAIIKETTWSNFKDSFDGKFVSIRVLFPRKSQDKCVEIVIFDKEKRMVTFFAVQEQNSPILAPRFPYHIELTQSGNLRIVVNNFEDADTTSAEWLADKLFAKLLKWADNGVIDDKIVKSLSLVAPDEYCGLYSRLKSKYGENLIKQWPEKAKTDPQKYVFEDIGIVAYLICLWRKIGAENINFVDCGCGNGLLVYILNQEGYKGCGFDIRRRNVWDLYANEADLKVGTITSESSFPEATWIIGNHSDELTPWIPIIAMNSSPKTNYFVLPCCPYDLNGRKYVRQNTALSQYGDYLDYVKKISSLCGFATSIDKLRIPSTRRTCLVGVREDFTIKPEITDFLSKHTSRFVARNSIEQVRNCTQLDKKLIARIISFVVKKLLESEYFLTKANGKLWNQGGTIDLGKLCQEISTEDKHSLKKECGGLQTLLKNHRYIFDVKKGSVALRKPLSLQETNKYKDKPCWFLQNHPNGCFFEPETCAYKHVL